MGQLIFSSCLVARKIFPSTFFSLCYIETQARESRELFGEEEKMKSLNWFSNNTTQAKLVINVNFQFFTSRQTRRASKEINSVERLKIVIRFRTPRSRVIMFKWEISERRKIHDIFGRFSFNFSADKRHKK
jgi:hypothetical protein